MDRFDIVIDPGHGDDLVAGHSTPTGVRGPGGTAEKDVTLQLALHVADVLGPSAHLTRVGDANLSLADRAATAQNAGARVFVSLHANGGRPSERGAEAWIHGRAGGGSRDLAAALLLELRQISGAPPDRGIKTGTIAVLTPDRLAPDAAACLLEVDFLSDPAGEQRLCDPASLAQIGDAVARGIQAYLSRALPAGAQPISTGASAGAYGRPGPRPRAALLPRGGRLGAAAGKRALLVGINDYTAYDPSGNNNLGGCVGDVNAVYNLLQRPELGFAAGDIQRLTDRSASKPAILAALRGLMTQSQAGDVLCFYYSGHGDFIPDPDTNNPGRFAQALFCADGGELRDRELADLVTASLADGVNFTVLLDSCFSGGMGEVAGTSDAAPRGMPLPSDMCTEGASLSLMPVGLCVPNGRGDPSINVSVSNARLMCEPRPNTTVVPYARAILFTAVDGVELAGERGGRGDYTKAIEAVITGAGRALTNQELQQGVVEQIEAMRQQNLADGWANPMLRGQGSRMGEGFLQPYVASEVGLALSVRTRPPRTAPPRVFAPAYGAGIAWARNGQPPSRGPLQNGHAHGRVGASNGQARPVSATPRPYGRPPAAAVNGFVFAHGSHERYGDRYGDGRASGTGQVGDNAPQAPPDLAFVTLDANGVAGPGQISVASTDADDMWPKARKPFLVRWTEANVGAGNMGQYTTRVWITDDNAPSTAAPVFEHEVPSDGLGHSATVNREVRVDAQGPGHYTIHVSLNTSHVEEGPPGYFENNENTYGIILDY